MGGNGDGGHAGAANPPPKRGNFTLFQDLPTGACDHAPRPTSTRRSAGAGLFRPGALRPGAENWTIRVEDGALLAARNPLHRLVGGPQIVRDVAEVDRHGILAATDELRASRVHGARRAVAATGCDVGGSGRRQDRLREPQSFLPRVQKTHGALAGELWSPARIGDTGERETARSALPVGRPTRAATRADFPRVVPAIRQRRPAGLPASSRRTVRVARPNLPRSVLPALLPRRRPRPPPRPLRLQPRPRSPPAPRAARAASP